MWTVGLLATGFSGKGFLYFSKAEGNALYFLWLHTEVAAYGIFVSVWLLLAFMSRPLRQMGLWSFSLYLWQQPFYLACTRVNCRCLWRCP